jgi:hypothetical protein
METRLLEIRYLGRVKTRSDGTQSAFGLCNDRWSVSILKPALFDWFGLSQRPGEANTLYNVLGVASTVDDDEIKKAYRRLVRQWHPDVCRETGAREQFESIQAAYEMLSKKRARYDAGLAMQTSIKTTQAIRDVADMEYGYRSPLRCGYVLGEGSPVAGKFTVSRILQWTDIMNAKKQILVVSWVMGEDKHREEWV